MKLPNFLESAPLNSLRQVMGATRLGDLTLRGSVDVLTVEELERLSGVGVDVSADQVRVLPDGTLAYKDSRVVLYIRDQPISPRGDGPSYIPKFHISECRTYLEKKAAGQVQKFVVATRPNGEFAINLTGRGGPRPAQFHRLDVCQNCLEALAYDGFYSAMDRTERVRRVSAFSLPEFFEKYPRAFMSGAGHDTDLTAPLNDYPPGFSEFARRIKAASGYRCTACARDCSGVELRRFLHAHHVNGIKYDSSLKNMRVLCFKCHMEQPNHGHMRAHPDYAEFCRAFGMSGSAT